MLSSIYQPQNEYAVAVDSRSSAQFQQVALGLSACFHNVHIFVCARKRRPLREWVLSGGVATG